MNGMHDGLVSRQMLAMFSGSAAVMLVHKVECWLTAEWVVSPFYQWAIGKFAAYSTDPAQNLGQAGFFTFVFCLAVSVLAISMLLSGRRGTHVFLGLWGVMFAVEWHHIVRSLVAGEYYSGLYTAIVFVALGPLYWRQLAVEMRGEVSAPCAVR